MDLLLFSTLYFAPIIIHFDAQIAPDLANGESLPAGSGVLLTYPINFWAFGPIQCSKTLCVSPVLAQNQPFLQGANPTCF